MNEYSFSIKENKKSRKLFFCLLTLLLMLCSAQYVFQVWIPQACYLAIAFLIALTGDLDEIVALCICCIPLYGFFESVFAVLFAIICYVAKNPKGLRLNYSIFPVILMVLWELAHCFLPNFRIMKFGGQCVPWLFLTVLMCSEGERFDYGFVVRSFALSVACMCGTLFVRIMYVVHFQIVNTFAMLQRLGVEVEDAIVKINPNSLGIFCVLGISGLLQLRIAKKGKEKDMVYVVILLLFGMMTASKTFFFCLMFSLLLLFMSVERKIEEKLRYGMGILAIGLIVLGISFLIMPNLVEYYISRFYEKDFTTGRTALMRIYHDFIVSNLDIILFGVGLQDFGTEIVRRCSQAFSSPHNCIQEIVIAWGMPGLFLCIALWSTMLICSRKRCGKQKLVHFIPFLVIFLKSQAGQILNSEYTVLAFGFSYLSLCADLTDAPDKPQSVTFSGKGDDGIDLRHAVGVLWQKRMMLALIALICAGTAFVGTKKLIRPTYEAEVLFYVNNSHMSVSKMLDKISNGDIVASRRLVATYRAILSSRGTIDDVIALSNVDSSYDEIRERIVADSVNDTEILRVTVESLEPTEAANIANAIAEILPRRISEIIDGTSARVIDYAVVPTKASSPSKSINTVIGFMIGFVSCVMVLLWQAMHDTKIKIADLAEISSYPVFAEIPKLEDQER